MLSNRRKNKLIWHIHTIQKNEITPCGLKNTGRGFLLLLMVTRLFQTNPLTENNYKIQTACMCVYMYKYLFEGVVELARQQRPDGPRSYREGKPGCVSPTLDSSFPFDPLLIPKMMWSSQEAKQSFQQIHGLEEQNWNLGSAKQEYL